jgi:DNA processing protein
MTGPTWTAAHADAWLALALVEGLAPRKAFDLATLFGSPAAVLSASYGALAATGLDAGRLDRVAGARERAARERAAIERAGGAIITWGDDRYPVRLRSIADPPLALFVRGSLVASDTPAVAIVGARRAGEYGRRIAEQLACGLAQAGLTVVSGLAAGIDGAAHRGSLDAGGQTVAVMATGLDRIYPSWHGDLARRIAAQGAIVTEFPLGSIPLHFHFPQRNRIISGLSVGTVVVEAAERSGSLITAEYAVEQGRDVFAVPGPIGVPQHRGCHRLIQQGAKLVTGVDDVLMEIAPALCARVAQARAAAEAVRLTVDERALVDALAGGALHVDTLVARTALAPSTALETLLALELRGLVEQRPGMRFAGRCAA